MGGERANGRSEQKAEKEEKMEGGRTDQQSLVHRRKDTRCTWEKDIGLDGQEREEEEEGICG